MACGNWCGVVRDENVIARQEHVVHLQAHAARGSGRARDDAVARTEVSPSRKSPVDLLRAGRRSWRPCTSRGARVRSSSGTPARRQKTSQSLDAMTSRSRKHESTRASSSWTASRARVSSFSEIRAAEVVDVRVADDAPVERPRSARPRRRRRAPPRSPAPDHAARSPCRTRNRRGSRLSAFDEQIDVVDMPREMSRRSSSRCAFPPCEWNR